MELGINNGTGKKSPLGDLGVVFHSNGKLLITAEYLVLKGALALAVPLNIGQTLHVEETGSGFIDWRSTVKGEAWLNARISLSSFKLIDYNNAEKAGKLLEILHYAKQLNPLFLSNYKGCRVIANVEFPLEWGLGSSSTLISNIARWSACDAYQLNRMAFQGSGYDIACARSNSPLLYQLIDEKPHVQSVGFAPPFISQLFLVWLGQKQNSRDEISRFDKNKDYRVEIEKINRITMEMFRCKYLVDFIGLLEQHENIISSVIHKTKVKEQFFPDFDGTIKSLGAWGGDFALVATEKSFEYVQKYFNQKDFHTVLMFSSLIF
jgi:mevalonate kinase